MAFLGSFLLFESELLIAKILLPYFGGSARVWTTCMMFFQGVLLAGYLYARLTTVRLPVRKQALLHLAVLAAAAFSLPFRTAPVQTAHPVAALLAALAFSIGLPFFALSATVPVIQRWLSASARPERGAPYTLYAASNAGALAALLAYPFVIEPLLPLDAQVRLWQFCYALFAAGHLLCFPPADASEERPAAARRCPPLPPARLLAWATLSAGPCAAMLAATQFLTSEMAAVPLLWIAPLGIYLGTFILNFRERGSAVFPRWALFLTAAPAAGLAAMAFLGRNAFTRDAAIGFSGFFLNIAALFVIAMICHRSLAADKPAEPEAASAYYLAVSAGGFLAGLLMGIILPYFGRGIGWTGLDWCVAGALSLSALVIRDRELWRAKNISRTALLLGASVPVCAVLLLAHGGRAAGLTLRNFYGISRVEDKDGMRLLLHGNTLHGTQYLAPDRAAEPTLYYSRSSPLGDVFRLFGPEIKDAGVLGLGAGTIAAYGTKGMKLTFYELDPDVEAIARGRFTFLSGSPALIRVITGDARLSLEKAEGTAHDLLILDAYNSGAIPAHLLTREAFELYFKRLAPGGLILCHISNRYLDLKPLMAAAARDLGVHGAVRAESTAAGGGAGAQKAQWAAFSRDGGKILRLEAAAAWRDAAVFDSRFVRPWTDRYASLLPLIRF
ncbi:MAG: fused MFS/spermidine synthase [Elusimicrobiota bacterium]